MKRFCVVDISIDKQNILIYHTQVHKNCRGQKSWCKISKKILFCWLAVENSSLNQRVPPASKIILVRYALKQKKTILFGNFSHTSDPAPPPPFWEPLIKKKILVFILHFRPLGTFLIFTKKLKFCQYFYIYFWE